ncbi:unnamed protein product, partial [Prorocentrum cordatum]
MVAMHLLRQDARVVGALLVSPTPGLPHCLRQGIWPFPVRGVLALIACALSLCDVTDLEACSRSDLNRAWLLRGLEQRTLTAEALRLAEESSRPGPAAAAGLGVWLRRRLGDFAALSAGWPPDLDAPRPAPRGRSPGRPGLGRGGLARRRPGQPACRPPGEPLSRLASSARLGRAGGRFGGRRRGGQGPGAEAGGLRPLPAVRRAWASRAAARGGRGRRRARAR